MPVFPASACICKGGCCPRRQCWACFLGSGLSGCRLPGNGRALRGLDTARMARALRVKELPSTSWLWEVVAPSHFPNPRAVTEPFSFSSPCPASWQGCGHGAVSGVLAVSTVCASGVSNAGFRSRAHRFLRHSDLGLTPHVNMVGIFYAKYETRLMYVCDNNFFHIFKLNFMH